MFLCYPSGFASRNVSVFYWPIWSYDFVSRFYSPYQKGGGYTYSSPYAYAFLRIKVLFANLLAHFCNGIDAVLSRKGGMKMKVEWRKRRRQVGTCSDKSRKKRELMREIYERKENSNSVQITIPPILPSY